MAEPRNYLAELAGLLEEPRKEVDFFAALGEFIVSYALAEAAVHVLVRALSGMEEDRARAVFSGMRLGDLTGRARQMMRLGIEPTIFQERKEGKWTQDDYDFMDACFAQLDKISAVRGELVHRTVTFTENNFKVSNLFTAKSVLHTQTRYVSFDDLEAMDRDCLKIFVRLHWLAQRETLVDGVNAEAQKALDEPWRYTRE